MRNESARAAHLHNHSQWNRHPSLCHPERSRGLPECETNLHALLISTTTLNGGATLPFVIPSVAEGSAV